MSAAEIPATPTGLDLSRRDERALAMRIAGRGESEIGQTFGWTPEQVHEALERALTRVTVERNPEGVAHQRGLIAARLDGLLAAQWDAATDTTRHPVIQQGAAKIALSVIDRQAALYGTNAPKETVVTHAVGPEQVSAVLERLFEARSGVVEANVITGEIEDADIVEDSGDLFG